MILSKQVTYRGNRINVSDLKPNSEIRVFVECPQCHKTRNAFYKSIKDNQICQVCATRKAHMQKVKVGTKFSRLTYKKFEGGKHVWICDCGKTTKAKVCSVKNGHTKSCGCLKNEHMSELGKEMTKKWKGENHPNWQGGISSERERFNSSKAAKEWRVSVFERDNYTCQHCEKVGYKLNAHHIYPFALYPEKRLEISNGLTLCEKCHIELHKKIGKPKRRKEKLQVNKT